MNEEPQGVAPEISDIAAAEIERLKTMQENGTLGAFIELFNGPMPGPAPSDPIEEPATLGTWPSAEVRAVLGLPVRPEPLCVCGHGKRAWHPTGGVCLYREHNGLCKCNGFRPAQPAQGAKCDMGMDCEENGTCYAEYHGRPEMCGKTVPAQSVSAEERARELIRDVSWKCSKQMWRDAQESILEALTAHAAAEVARGEGEAKGEASEVGRLSQALWERNQDLAQLRETLARKTGEYSTAIDAWNAEINLRKQAEDTLARMEKERDKAEKGAQP